MGTETGSSSILKTVSSKITKENFTFKKLENKY